MTEELAARVAAIEEYLGMSQSEDEGPLTEEPEIHTPVWIMCNDFSGVYEYIWNDSRPIRKCMEKGRVFRTKAAAESARLRIIKEACESLPLTEEPRIGTQYWVLNIQGGGDISIAESPWDGDSLDIGRLRNGRVFTTKRGAKAALARVQAALRGEAVSAVPAIAREIGA